MTSEVKIKRTYNVPRYKERPALPPEEVRVTVHGTVKRKHYQEALKDIKQLCKKYQ